MFIVPKGEIEGRIDPCFYKPHFRVHDRSKFKTLNELSRYILHPPEYLREFSENGVQLIRSQNVRPTGISIDENPVFFSAEFLKDKKHIFAKKDDVLIVRSGVNAGDVAFIENDMANAIIGADTLLCRCSENLIPKFLQVYFYTSFGKAQILKHITGTTNKHLNSENLKKVFIPNIKLQIQREAISIFEQSLEVNLQKEQQAQALVAGIDAYLLAELGINLPEQDTSLPQRIFLTNFKQIVSNRLDAGFHYKFNAIFSKPGKYKYEPLKNLLTQSPQYGANEEASEPKSDKDVRYIRITDIDEYGNLKDTGWKTAVYVDEKYRLLVDDILFARSGSVGRCYIHKNTNQDAIFAGYLIKFQIDKTKVNPDYLFYYCHSAIYKFWVSAIQRPSVQANINAEEYKGLLVPLPPIDKQNEIANHIASIRNQAKQLQTEAAQIQADAKAEEVERLILGE